VLTDIVRNGTWKGKAGFATADVLAGGFMGFWEDHRSVLRVVDLATEEATSASATSAPAC
jgi:hypothetical protein